MYECEHPLEKPVALALFLEYAIAQGKIIDPLHLVSINPVLLFSDIINKYFTNDLQNKV